MEQEIATLDTGTVQGDAVPGLGDSDPSLLTAVHASEESPNDSPSGGESERVLEYTKDEVDRARAEERLRLQVEAQQADLARVAQFKARQAQEEQLRKQQEEKDLYERARSGDLSAQETIYQNSIKAIEARNKRAEIEEAFAPERATVRDQVRRQVWEQYAQSFGVDPDDPQLLTMPPELGLKGITASILKKTQETDLIEAIKANPAIQRWIKETMQTGTESARAQGMARALGTPDAPRVDMASASGRALSGDALERALMASPDDPALYRAWVRQERTAGRYW